MKDFILYTQQYDAIKFLSIEQKGLLLDVLFHYAEFDYAPIIEDDAVMVAFNFIRQQIVRDWKSLDNQQ